MTFHVFVSWDRTLMDTGTRGSSATPEYSQDDGHDGEELAGSGELDSIIHLLPVREQPGLALVRGLEGGSLHGVQEDVHALQDTQREVQGGPHPKKPQIQGSGSGSLHPRAVPLEGRGAAGKPGAARETGKGELGKAGAARLLHVRPLARLLGVSQGGGGKITALGSLRSGD